ncbi:D-mannonate dehydratase ManD [Vibrio algivorus]|uniref:D-mannonate dehydratase CC2812 n=1 Tax=Vibrio algivorus TaxID=1667024 RepID=A0ABQ6ERC5_9VIBR|nr:D-mannonate dehydratase ManD [Vibrio algivorus]GLT15286.1 D-mannonate dehydratase CC2812 [Vibrio algivorus]
MNIQDIKVFVCSPGRNFVTVKVITEDGTYGLGDATVNGRELAVATYLEEHVVPCLIGRDAHSIEDIWQYLYQGVYWRRGPITMAAIAAIDMALWDIKGKVSGLPVYQLLGGKCRTGVNLYAHANGENIDDTLDKVQECIDQGFKAVRLQSAIPGLSETYGVLGDKKDYFELQGNRPLPPEQEWSTAKYFKLIPELFKKARERFGNQVHFLHDVHSRLTPIESAKLGKMLEKYNLLFLEDASIAENQENYKLIRHHTTTPLALGETYNTIWDCKDLLQNQLIDYIRVAATHAGGITGVKKISDFAAVYNVRTAPHGAPDLSPICFAAHMHLNISTHNFGIQEFVGFGNEESKTIFKHGMTLENGMVLIDDAPGLGVDFDETKASEFPYKRSYLPVSRLEDGTLWHW